MIFRSGESRVGVHVVQVPQEAVALESLLEPHSLCKITQVQILGSGPQLVVEVLEVVGPDLCEPGGVDGNGVHLVGDAARYGVRRRLSVVGWFNSILTPEIEVQGISDNMPPSKGW